MIWGHAMTLLMAGAGLSGGGPTYPTRIGETHVIRNTSGTASVTAAYPPGTASGDRAIFFVALGNGTNLTAPSGYSAVDSEVERLSANVGENVTFGILEKTLGSGDISAGSVGISLNSYSQAKLEIWRNVDSLALDASGPLTSSAQNENSRPLQVVTASRACVAVAALWGGFSNEKARFAASSGWITGGTVPLFSSNLTGRYGVQTLRREIAAAGDTPSGTITTSGTANAYLGAITLLLYAPV